jgi:hypothetical protein
MADTIDLQVIAPTPASGSCVDSYLIQLMGQIRVLFPSQYSLTLTGPNEPTVEQRDYVWVKTDSITNEIVGTFTWSPFYGLWIYAHPSLPETSERRLWVGSLVSLETFDGGESATVSATTGPFWEQDTDYNDKFIVGANGTAVGSDYASNITGGAADDALGTYIIKRTARRYVRSA